MVELCVDHFAGGAESCHTVHIYLSQQVCNQLNLLLHFVDEGSEELDHFGVVEEDAEVEAVEEGVGVVLDVLGVVTYDLDDVLIDLHVIIQVVLLFHKPVRFFKSVEHLVVEVHFLPKL